MLLYIMGSPLATGSGVEKAFFPGENRCFGLEDESSVGPSSVVNRDFS